MRPTRARLCDAIITEGGARVRSCSTPADMASPTPSFQCFELRLADGVSFVLTFHSLVASDENECYGVRARDSGYVPAVRACDAGHVRYASGKYIAAG